jgi:hypothetical protein
MGARCDAVGALGKRLGDDHDLSVFRRTLMDAPDEFGGGKTLQVMISLIERRQAQLRDEAQPLGMRLFAEKPKALAARFRTYWNAWQRDPVVAPAEAPVPPDA